MDHFGLVNSEFVFETIIIIIMKPKMRGKLMLNRNSHEPIDQWDLKGTFQRLASN